MIDVQNLSKKFGSIEVLKEINITFETGKIYGIVGENGAGKTTLFRCISGLERFVGKVVSDLAPLKDHLGLLFTEPFFFDKMTGREYIRLMCQARKKDAHNLDDRNIFDLPLDQYASTYSTGMKKKLALLAILMQENEYFILDEPFNGVDIQSNIVITDIINSLRDLGKTVVISSHIFSTLRETCDEIHVLDQGQFIKSVSKSGFQALEDDMKDVHIGNKLERLGLK
jgi:ABC-2 type transport system ATP-binding protein